jgi:carboxypeptidase family protein
MIRINRTFFVFLIGISSVIASGQETSAPEPQNGSIFGIVMDVSSGAIPGATVAVDGASPSDHHTATADETGSFEVKDLRPATPYHVRVSAKGFADWTSPVEITLHPGQAWQMADINLNLSVVETSVAAVLPEQLALEAEQQAVKQRVLGFIPNFYVTYDTDPVPLTTKLKYKLAFRVAIDPVSIGADVFLAGINQAADTPDYQQGLKGYGQRFGAAYASGFTDIMIGGAVLPSLLHQDPRYFYRGTGSNKSRFIHAIASPVWCRGDNGVWQFNYSSVGGDLASGAIANLYYPEANRGPGLVISTALINTGARIANALAQEFILRKFTSNSTKTN